MGIWMYAHIFHFGVNGLKINEIAKDKFCVK